MTLDLELWTYDEILLVAIDNCDNPGLACARVQPFWWRSNLQCALDRAPSRQPWRSPVVCRLLPQVAGVATLSPTQLQSLAWTLRYTSTTTANLGACDTLKETVQQAFTLQPPPTDAPLRVLVDLTAAANPEVSSVAGDGSVDVATLSRAVDIGTGVTGGLYAIAGAIQHDMNCPGSYVMGRVVNAGGGPVAGIQVNLRDQWGNQAYTASKSGATDYGLFDFPIPSGSPHELYLTVMDGSGNPISATFTIFHKMGDAGDAPCHHIVLQGG